MNYKTIKKYKIEIILFAIGFVSLYIIQSLGFVLLLFDLIYFFIHYNKNEKVIDIKPKITNQIKQTPKDAKRNLDDKFLNKEFISLYNNLQDEFNNEKIFYDKHCCPNCGVIFDKPITTTKNCRYCNKKITKRSNYLTKENILIGQDRITDYIKFEEKRKELMLYEEMLLRLSYRVQNLKVLINNKRILPGIKTPRDLMWSLLNELALEYTNKGYKKFNTVKRMKEIDKILKITSVQFDFYIAYECYADLIKIAEHKNQYEALESLIPLYLHGKINIHLLEYLFDKYHDLDEERLFSCVSVNSAINYMNRLNLSLNDYEKIYKNNVSSFIIPTCSIDDSWEIVKTLIKNNSK